MASHACNAIDENVRCYAPDVGDSSVDLEIRFWIRDPMNGRANVTSDLSLGIWDRFAEHGIEIPYPQRDLHLRTPGSFQLSDDGKVEQVRREPED